MERSLGEDLGEGGAVVAVAVDRVGDAEVQRHGERHGFGEAQGLVPELDVRLEQVLLAALLHECHRVHVRARIVYLYAAGWLVSSVSRLLALGTLYSVLLDEVL